jgi:3-mercaptopyruvate sulfurtransferase SseA
VALLLRRQGIRKIRPLQGGLGGWKEKGYPMHIAETAQNDAAGDQYEKDLTPGT